MQRIIVVGTSCSGKTTVAARLAERLGLEHIEIDRINWQPDWQHIPTDELRARLKEATQADRWVVDGNYYETHQIVWPRATHVVWLNYSFPLIFMRALRRTIGRVFTQEKLYAGNTESFWRSFFTRDSILWWVIHSFPRNRRRYRRYQDERTYPNLEWIELRHPRDEERFLAGLCS